ncbi:MAG: TIGR03086 family protein [Pseudonocardia sp.]|nr:TIGR03086 family protein [Pseudonocardia sp.]
MFDDLRPAHRRALAAADALVARVGPDDLSRPTPCVGWDLGTLLAHMVGQHRGFAAAVRDGDAPAAAYAPVSWTPAAWAASAADLLAAFAAADLAAEVVEVELRTHPLPVAFLVEAHLLDTVVHSWDVATALGEYYEPAPDLVDHVARAAARIPESARTRPGAPFSPSLSAGSNAWERTLALLGRRVPAVPT